MPLYARAGAVARAGLLTLAVAGFAMSVITVTTFMAAPPSVENPLTDLIWPMFARGDLHNMLSITGNSGHLWLILLALPWVMMALATGLLRSRGPAPDSAPIAPTQSALPS